jgi:hypothetical protein
MQVFRPSASSPAIAGHCCAGIKPEPNADQRGLVLVVGEPDLEHAVVERRQAHDREEQRHLFAEHRPADLAPNASLRDGRSNRAASVIRSPRPQR